MKNMKTKKRWTLSLFLGTGRRRNDRERGKGEKERRETRKKEGWNRGG